MSDLLEVYLNETLVGKLVLGAGERILFTFNESYLQNPNRPVLSQSFLNQAGGVITDVKSTRMKLPPFFSNLLPEGHLRDYLARMGGVNPDHEFRLLELLGEDLPGAVRVKPLEYIGQFAQSEEKIEPKGAYHFSLAGIQLKFSALQDKAGGLTIPASGAGGDWIVKLPAQNFMQVPENEYSMLTLAKLVGIDVPELMLVNLDEIHGLPDMGVLAGKKALVVKRFDRQNGERIHIEDFAQVYGIYPDKKYEKISYNSIAKVVMALMGETGLREYIRRLMFTVAIGNGDMHAKNWSLIYPDGITAYLSPAYDFVSTIPYLPADKLSLTLGDTKMFERVTLETFRYLANKANVPEHIVVEQAQETFLETKRVWAENKGHFALDSDLLERIDEHMAQINMV